MRGVKLAIKVNEPLIFGLNPTYPGQMLALYKGSIPLIRQDLLDVLVSVGVDNLEIFNAILKDPIQNKEHHEYKAFNVIGLVSCLDRKRSIIGESNESHMINVDIRNLVIDESKTGDLLMFRLAEAVNAIVVHRTIKEAVELRAIPGMYFYGPGEWAS